MPMRVEPAASVDPNDADPRGMAVVAADRNKAGVVVDLWIDRGEPRSAYIEVETNSGKRVLLPMVFALIDGFRSEGRRDHVQPVRQCSGDCDAGRRHQARGRSDRRLFRRGSPLCTTPKRTGDIL